MDRQYYAIIQQDGFGNLVCIGLVDTYESKDGPEYVEIETYDQSLIDQKMWTGSEWVDNPNYYEPVPEQEEVL